MIQVIKLILGYRLLMVLFVFLGEANVAWASPLINDSELPLNNLMVTTNEGAELQLDVRHMLLSKVLDEIAFKTDVPIHYSSVPEDLVTAMCVGSNLKHILGCLLDRKADFVMSYTDAINKKQATEVWVLGSKFEDSSAKADCNPTYNILDESPSALQKNESTENSETDETDILLIKAQSHNVLERVSAMGELLAGGRIGDPQVKAVLEQGLTDQDAGVRAQAISSLSHREGNSVAAEIQEALHDTSVDVRLMAVDGITENIGLLQQAINDKDEVVRNLAKAKLSALIHAK